MPKTNEKHLKDIYWVSPTKMISFLLFGILMSLSHHLYYQSRVGKPVGNENDQQNKHRIGNFFAFVVQSSLATSMSIAYIQYLWMTLKEEEVKVVTLNSAFSALHSILFICNGEMRAKIRVGTIIALTAWCIPIPSLFTPATLYINPATSTSPTLGWVRIPDIADPSNENYFAYSVPSDGENSTTAAQLASQIFLGPRTILERLSVATASGGVILPITPPFVNASYQIQFNGPIVQCFEANDTQQAALEKLISQQLVTDPTTNVTQVMNSYYAYVPDLSAPDEAVNLVDRLQQPSNGSNQLWLSFRRNGTGWIDQPVPTCPIIEYRVCKLYNATYDLEFKFEEGNQTVEGYPPTLLNEVEFPILNLTAPSDLTQMAYSAYMWAFTNQLVGEMGFYNDTSTNKTTPAVYNEIRTEIGATSILGSSDLDCFFATNNVIPDIPGTANYTTLYSPQRQQDIDLAQNRTLDELIPELAFNTTVSLMSDALLSPPVLQTVMTTISINLYAYHKGNLLAAYAISILVAFIVNLLGAYAYTVNKVAHDINFTSLVSSTTDDTINTIFKKEDPSTRGKIPLPKTIGDVEIKFTPLDEGGLGFQTAEEVRRRSSVAPITSPQLAAMKKLQPENVQLVEIQPGSVQPPKVQLEGVQLEEAQMEKMQTEVVVGEDHTHQS
ncbi:hypothetical protein N431DRAFT_323907 [Stipitochalara longipes BDJ]|nr:hypothetical protein N431DRAFT_323907 [Stipitochalara longipes BDJ]